MRVALRILAIAGGIAVLALIVIAIAIATIDVNAFADPIRQRVRDATGRDFVIGSIGLTRSLTPTLVLDDVALGNAPWGKAPRLLTAKRIEARVALLPLLQRRIDIVRLELVEPVFALETAAEGRANWTFEGEPGTAAPAAMPARAAPAPGTLTVGDLAVARGTLTFRNDVSGRTTTVAIDALAMAVRGPESAIDIDFRGKIDAVAVDLEGELGSLEALRQRRWPYPVSVRGEIGGRKASLAAKLTVADGAFRLDDVDLAYGASAVKGEVTAATGGPRPKLDFKLAASTLTVADMPMPLARGAAAGPAARSPARTYVFAEVPVGFAPLRSIDLHGDVAVERLTLADGSRVDGVRARVGLRDGRAEVADFEAAAFGGSARMHLVVDASAGAAPRIALKLDATGLDLAALLGAAGAARDVRRGKTDLHADLTMRGDSPRQWASTTTGTVTATIGPATIVHSKLGAASALNRLAEAVDPFRRVDAATDLVCAAARLTFANGIARVDRSIALETKKIGVAASGTLDLRDETLDLSIRTSIRAGVPVDLTQFADLVRLRGPFASPAVAVDAKGSAETIARLGAAYASGGLSLLGESLLTHGAGGGECDAAMGRAPAPGAASAPASDQDRRKPGIDDIVNSLGRLLRR
jgi:uncharacterized protein involved in outer membrane biogenesis